MIITTGQRGKAWSERGKGKGTTSKYRPALDVTMREACLDFAIAIRMLTTHNTILWLWFLLLSAQKKAKKKQKQACEEERAVGREEGSIIIIIFFFGISTYTRRWHDIEWMSYGLWLMSPLQILLSAPIHPLYVRLYPTSPLCHSMPQCPFSANPPLLQQYNTSGSNIVLHLADSLLLEVFSSLLTY